jgi:hypothetical protein
MKPLNDIATGTICASFGFFGSRMQGVPVAIQLTTSITFAVAFTAVICIHPYFKSSEHNIHILVPSEAAVIALGWILSYGFDLPDYFTYPLMIGLAFMACAVAYKFEGEQRINPRELNELMRIAADITLPNSYLRNIALEPA